MSTARTLVARWQDWAGNSVEHVVLTVDGLALTAEGVHVSASTDGFAASYRIVCDPRGHTTAFAFGLVAQPQRMLTSDGNGRWKDESGRVLHALTGALEPDLSITPFTNSLPIRRLPSLAGQSTDILTAWVSFPDLAIHADPQRYTCLEPGRRWRYESLDSDFTRDIEIDADGLVITYPGLFRRIV